MALYQCKVGTEQGEVYTRSLIAENVDELRREFEKNGLFLLSARKNWLNTVLSPRGIVSRRIREQDFLIFNQQFAALLRSGLPVLRALDVILDKMGAGYFRDTLCDIREKIKAGRALSEAFAEKGRLFPRVYSASLLAGERSGNLDSVLRRYMGYQQQILAARRKMRSALIYPAVLLGLSLCLVLILTLYVIPKFATTFAENEAPLPLITTVLLSLTTTARADWHLFLGSLLLVAFLTLTWARSDSGRMTLDRLKFKLPVFGSIWSEFSMSQYARTFATLIAGGIPVVDAMEIAAAAMSNQYMGREAMQSVRLVKEGETVSTALESTGLFSSIAIELIRVGETTGSLDTMLMEMSGFLDERVDAKVGTLLSLLEPIVLVVMGVIIAVLLLSIYLPLFSMSQVVH